MWRGRKHRCVYLTSGRCVYLAKYPLIDIGDFLKEEIKGPASFSCTTGSGCKFEEPSMNQLISDIFGDGFISLTCEGGECLHYTMVPGYRVNNCQTIQCDIDKTFRY
jgi:hypothetical protein